MLTSIKIERLFNLYDYDIDLTNEDRSMIKFITAPNGYGKTTILDFIHEIMSNSYQRLFHIPFNIFQLTFQDKDSSERYLVTIQRESSSLDIDESTDDSGDDCIELNISLKNITSSEEHIIESFSLVMDAEGEISKRGTSNNVEMFFVSRTCHYITDNRKLNIKTDSPLPKVGDMREKSLAPYSGKLKEILNNPVQKEEYEKKIEVFKTIIKRSLFTHKHMEIDPRFGFRFIAEDELETKLSLDDLSSGEKHILIQFFELLFVAQEGTLAMIDEPELSFHMMWQMNFLRNIQDVANIRGFQCIIATHSPQIFNNMWSKTIDLYELSTQQSE